MKAKTRKITTISWSLRNGQGLGSGQSPLPVPLKLQSIQLTQETGLKKIFGRIILLYSVIAETTNGKDGTISFIIDAHHNQELLGIADIATIASALSTLDSHTLRFASAPKTTGQSWYTFDVRVDRDHGFCETVVSNVSRISSFLGVTGDRWFMQAMKIEQKTEMLVGGAWVEYGEHLTEKYPINLGTD